MVGARRAEIDGLVGEAAIGWDLDRMAVVDRNVLRLATAELLACDDVPTAVILNEAVELASAFSTDDSGRFVNGVLATVAARVRPEVPEQLSRPGRNVADTGREDVRRGATVPTVVVDAVRRVPDRGKEAHDGVAVAGPRT